MAFYGLFVFLETPEDERKGRKKYIATSFAITCLSSFTASLDIANYFQVLFESTSPLHWTELWVANVQSWEVVLSKIATGILVSIGDALLVSGVYHHTVLAALCLMYHIVSTQVYRCYVIFVDYWWVAIVPGATCLCALGGSCFFRN
jgi:hypothetical protein